MGLAIVNGNLPTYRLVPEALLIKLAKKAKRQRPEAPAAEDSIITLTSSRLMCALRRNKLRSFYAGLVREVNRDENITRHLSELQRSVVIDKCLRKWLVDVESMVSFVTHINDSDKPEKFAFPADEAGFRFSLRRVSQLRTFLYRELELPAQTSKSRTPNYEGR